MQLRDSVADLPFSAETFEQLRTKLAAGALDARANRLPQAPVPLDEPPRRLQALAEAERTTLFELGQEALRTGRVASLVLNGGMATRFGGGAKGVVSIVSGRPDITFIAVKLAQVRRRAELAGGSIPAVIMSSFATRAATSAHLSQIEWAGLASADRHEFVQSIMPRVDARGVPLQDLPGAAELGDELVYSAPGHGDTLMRLRESGVLDRLRDRGVEHFLISNVDNLGADVDPIVVGAHLEAVRQGVAITVEVVPREQGDVGGCVAKLPGGSPAIIEGFRLPEGIDLGVYPHFNTNTLWLTAEACARRWSLQWFAVRKTIPWPDGSNRDVVQFEQLIGQATELVPSAYVEVDRAKRFLPIKTRDDVATAHARLREYARDAGLVSG